MRYNKNSPRFLNLVQIHLPVTGLVSILHRLSGVVLFLLLPVLLYLLELSLSSAVGFTRVQSLLYSWPLQLAGLLVLWLFFHHLLAGLRVLFIDMEWGSDLSTARRTAWMTLFGAIVLVMLGAAL